MPKLQAALHIEVDRSVLFGVLDDAVELGTSPYRLAAKIWPQGQPTALQLERAIDDIENAIERTGVFHADRGCLLVDDSLHALLPERLRQPGICTRDEVELEFSRLVAAAAANAPNKNETLEGLHAASLVLLREVMHHLGFQTFSPQIAA